MPAPVPVTQKSRMTDSVSCQMRMRLNSIDPVSKVSCHRVAQPSTSTNAIVTTTTTPAVPMTAARLDRSNCIRDRPSSHAVIAATPSAMTPDRDSVASSVATITIDASAVNAAPDTRKCLNETRNRVR